MSYLTYPSRTEAQRRTDELTEARLREVWGDRYDGQTLWPDGITDRAVDVTDLTDGRAAFPVDARHERHYTAGERENQRARIDDLLPDRGSGREQ